VASGVQPFVMFGQSGLFGDYAELVHALGGFLQRVVVNVPEIPHPRRPSFEERLARHERQRRALGVPEPTRVEKLADFRPAAGERYLVGFRGAQLLPLRDQLALRFGVRFEPLVHPAAFVSPSATLGEGTIVAAGAVIASHARLGRFALVNRAASVGHDAHLCDFANVGPGANLASNVRVGFDAAVGIGAAVIEDVEIGESAQVAAGAVVIRDVPARTLVAGVPAVVKKASGRA
jgi:sugar O-acyltransferase (sialic acid O-acetyltransferase NeuD family)